MLCNLYASLHLLPHPRAFCHLPSHANLRIGFPRFFMDETNVSRKSRERRTGKRRSRKSKRRRKRRRRKRKKQRRKRMDRHRAKSGNELVIMTIEPGVRALPVERRAAFVNLYFYMALRYHFWFF
jgi:hypothetical protein